MRGKKQKDTRAHVSRARNASHSFAGLLVPFQSTDVVFATPDRQHSFAGLLVPFQSTDEIFATRDRQHSFAGLLVPVQATGEVFTTPARQKLSGLLTPLSMTNSVVMSDDNGGGAPRHNPVPKRGKQAATAIMPSKRSTYHDDNESVPTSASNFSYPVLPRPVFRSRSHRPVRKRARTSHVSRSPWPSL